jgi:hypothetical protein
MISKSRILCRHRSASILYHWFWWMSRSTCTHYFVHSSQRRQGDPLPGLTGANCGNHRTILIRPERFAKGIISFRGILLRFLDCESAALDCRPTGLAAAKGCRPIVLEGEQVISSPGADGFVDFALTSNGVVGDEGVVQFEALEQARNGDDLIALLVCFVATRTTRTGARNRACASPSARCRLIPPLPPSCRRAQSTGFPAVGRRLSNAGLSAQKSDPEAQLTSSEASPTLL